MKTSKLKKDVFDSSRKVFISDKTYFTKIVMNFYEKRNTFSEQFGREFVECLDYFYSSKHNICIITGVKDCFNAGANLTEVSKKNTSQMKSYLSRIITQLNKIEMSDKIFISAVNGVCVGGGFETALATDYIIASRDSVFGLPEIKLGLIPGADGIKRLVKSIGRHQAFELIATGDTISAKEAYRVGMINEIVPRNKLVSRTEKLAKELAIKNPVALFATKRLCKAANSKDITKSEIDAFVKCANTKYAKDAIHDFLNKKINSKTAGGKRR